MYIHYPKCLVQWFEHREIFWEKDRQCGSKKEGRLKATWKLKETLKHSCLSMTIISIVSSIMKTATPMSPFVVCFAFVEKLLAEATCVFKQIKCAAYAVYTGSLQSSFSTKLKYFGLAQFPIISFETICAQCSWICALAWSASVESLFKPAGNFETKVI